MTQCSNIALMGDTNTRTYRALKINQTKVYILWS